MYNVVFLPCSEVTREHDVRTNYWCTLNSLVNPNCVAFSPLLPCSSLPSLYSLLWKLLLAHPWIHLAAFSLIPSRPPSQYVSRSHGRAAVFRYVSGESMSERGEDRPIDDMPNQSGGSSFNTANVVYRHWHRDKAPLKAGIPTVT